MKISLMKVNFDYMKGIKCKLVYPIGNGVYSKEFNTIKDAKEYVSIINPCWYKIVKQNKL